MNAKVREPRIVILGAGPSGLYTAHFLKKQGYRNVLVLEKEGHVGGLCRTITSGGRSFDLGANYLTPAYKLTLKLANEVGAKVYSERPFVAMSVPEDPEARVRYEPIYQALRVDLKTGNPVPWLKFIGTTLKFVWLRWKLKRVVDRPTFDGIEKFDGGSLCRPFEQWLDDNGLSCLATSFELPITQMGFGYLSQTPAVYALKFMTLATYVPMVLKEAPIIGPLLGWPKRFTLGYQRMWQRVAWGLDVRMNVNVRRIERNESGIHLQVETEEENLSEIDTGREAVAADCLIFACPMRPFTKQGTHSDVIELSEEEESLFSRIRITSYCMTTLQIDDMQLGKGRKGGGPLASIFPVPQLGEDRRVVTYGVAKQWNDNPLVQFYTTSYSTDAHDDVKREVLADVAKIAGQMGGTVVRERDWQTFDRWTYFQHVDTNDMLGNPERGEDGWYTRLERLQGTANTFYVGGATNFELIESIGMYTRNLVEQNFPKRS
jgi:hypothetical protein